MSREAFRAEDTPPEWIKALMEADYSHLPSMKDGLADKVNSDLHALWDHVLTERVPDYMQELLDSILDSDRELLGKLK